MEAILQNWVVKCNDKHNKGKIQNLIKSTKTSSPTGNSGATSLPPTEDSFMYKERSQNISGSEKKFVSLNGMTVFKLVILLSLQIQF